MFRRSLMAVASLVLCTACPPPKPLTPDGSVGSTTCQPTGEGCDCVATSDCPGPVGVLACNPLGSACRASCVQASDCNVRPAGFELERCAGELGCTCDRQTCIPAQCSTDAECGARVCRDGACVDLPVASAVTSCSLVPDFVVASAGETVRFTLLLNGADDAPVVIPGLGTWAVVLNALTGSGQGAGADFVVAASPTSAPQRALTVTAGSATCHAQVLVLPVAATGDVVVSVVDENTQRPIDNAAIVFSAADGASLGQQSTGAMGWYQGPLPAGTAAVSVFHPDFSYRTVALAGVTGGESLAFALHRNPSLRTGGVRATFTEPVDSNIHLARVGFASLDPSRGDFTDEFEPRQLVTASIGSAISYVDTPFPMGTGLSMVGSPIKPTASAAGANGVCLLNDGSVDEVKTAAGECGRGAAWALMGNVPAAEFPLENALQDGLPSTLMDVLVHLPDRPFFSSSIRRDARFTLGAATVNDAGVPDFARLPSATAVVHAYGQVPASFSMVVQTPDALEPGAAFLVVGAARSEGRGLVPLGVGAAPDEKPIDGLSDGSRDGFPGTATLRMAPSNHGLEGTPYVVVVQSRSNAWKADARVGFSRSARVHAVPGQALWNEQLGARKLDARAAFLEAPRGLTFNALTRRFAATAVSGTTSVMRVTFTDGLGSQWDVLLDASAPSIALPAVPGTLRDRLFENGQQTGGRVEVEATTLVHSGVAFAVYRRSQLAQRRLDDLEAFSTATIRRPRVALLAAQTNINTSGSVIASIEGYEDAHSLRLSVGGMPGCSATTVPLSNLNGASRVVLPVDPGCHGSSRTLRVELLDGTLQPLAQPVSVSTLVTLP